MSRPFYFKSLGLRRLGFAGGGGGILLDQFPTVIDMTVANSGFTTQTSHLVSVPVSRQNLDGILVLYQVSEHASHSPTNPAGFGAPFINANYGSDNRTRLYAWWKISDGTETDFNIIDAHASSSIVTCMIIRNVTGTPVANTATVVSTTNPDVPSITTGFGAVKQMIIAMAGQGNNIGQAFSGVYPTGYADNQDYSGSGNFRQRVLCSKEVEADPEDPPAFGSWGFARWRYAIAIGIQGT